MHLTQKELDEYQNMTPHRDLPVDYHRHSSDMKASVVQTVNSQDITEPVTTTSTFVASPNPSNSAFNHFTPLTSPPSDSGLSIPTNDNFDTPDEISNDSTNTPPPRSDTPTNDIGNSVSPVENPPPHVHNKMEDKTCVTKNYESRMSIFLFLILMTVVYGAVHYLQIQNITIPDPVRVALQDADPPPTFWGAAALHTAGINQNLPHTLTGKTPREACGLPSQLQAYNRFGAAAYVYDHRDTTKLDTKGHPGIYIGFSPPLHTDIVYLLDTGRIVSTDMMIIDEEKPPGIKAIDTTRSKIAGPGHTAGTSSRWEPAEEINTSPWPDLTDHHYETIDTNHFKLKYIGEMGPKPITVLGMDVTYHRDIRQIRLTQTTEINRLILEHGLMDAVPTNLPLPVDTQFSPDTAITHSASNLDKNLSQLQKFNGQLMWFQRRTVPELAMAAQMLAKATKTHTNAALKTATNDLKYLKGQSEAGITFNDSNVRLQSRNQLYVEYDAEWAGDKTDRLSKSEIVIYFNIRHHYANELVVAGATIKCVHIPTKENTTDTFLKLTALSPSLHTEAHPEGKSSNDTNPTISKNPAP